MRQNRSKFSRIIRKSTVLCIQNILSSIKKISKWVILPLISENIGNEIYDFNL